jgi:hypothetical protein
MSLMKLYLRLVRILFYVIDEGVLKIITVTDRSLLKIITVRVVWH